MNSYYLVLISCLTENFSIIISLIFVFLLIVYRKYKSTQNVLESTFHNPLNTRFRAKECPPPYPNGWLPVLESRDLMKNQVKSIFGFDNELVAFRGASGKVYILDAYCPHMGANLGIGGTVIGDEIRCPFHGWKFNNEGNCTEVPGIECTNTPKVNIKVWDSLEVNGFICVWNHSKGDKPNWVVQPIKEIRDRQFVYIGRWEHTAFCHIQEIMENNADGIHFNVIHNVPEFLGSFISKVWFYDQILKYFNLNYKLTFDTCAEPHLSEMEYFSTYNAGSFKFTSDVKVKLHGPALGSLKANIFNKIYVQSLAGVISKGPMEQKIVHHFYALRYNLISYILAYYVLNFYRLQVDRDVYIWDTKKFLKNPYLMKNESTIKTFRRWYKNFYTEE